MTPTSNFLISLRCSSHFSVYFITSPVLFLLLPCLNFTLRYSLPVPNNFHPSLYPFPFNFAATCLTFMNFIDHRVAALVRDSQTLHQSFEDRSLIFEAAKSQHPQRSRRRLHRRVCSSPERRARIPEEARLARLVNHSERILLFLTRQYPSLKAAEGTHCYMVYDKIEDRIRLHRPAISNDDDILTGFSALSL
jgi:hypothetical protein